MCRLGGVAAASSLLAWGCCFLPDVAVGPTPSPAERCLTACLPIQRPGGVKSRLTTTCCGWPLPETRDAVSLQHCSYVLVNHLRAPFLLVTGRSRLFSARKPAGGAPKGAEYPRNTPEALASAPHGQGRRRHRCGHDRGARPRRRRAGPGGRRRLPGADPALPPPRLGRARRHRDLGRRPGHPGRDGRPPGRTGRHRRRHRHHQPARDAGGVRPLDRTSAAPRHRVAGPAHRAHLRRAHRGGAPPLRARHDRPRPRPVLQRHQGGLAAPARRARTRSR